MSRKFSALSNTKFQYRVHQTLLFSSIAIQYNNPVHILVSKSLTSILSYSSRGRFNNHYFLSISEEILKYPKYKSNLHRKRVHFSGKKQNFTTNEYPDLQFLYIVLLFNFIMYKNKKWTSL
jgi:hypothetical protein